MSEQEFKQQRTVGRRAKKSNRTISTGRQSWFHLGHDGSLHICNQRFGQPSTGQVRLTRAEFEQFVRFYKKAEAAGRGSEALEK